VRRSWSGCGWGAATGNHCGAATGHVPRAAIGRERAAAGALTAGYPGDEGAEPIHLLPRLSGAVVSGRPGLVISPYPPHRLVDVRGHPYGALVRDPSTGGIFVKP